MTKLSEIIDLNHLLDKIRTIPHDLIGEIIFIVLTINGIYSYIYYSLYKMNKEHFKNNIDLQKELTFFDFFYFSNTLFFSLGYDITPKSIVVRTICTSQMILSFIITTMYVAKIISLC